MPARFPEHRLRFRNDRAAATVALDQLGDAEWIAHFARFEPVAENLPLPLALRYHGHQFQAYNPDLGDGRGFTFVQRRDDRGRLLDLGTKGSGTTPYSRSGDGRLTLKGGVREILATEMLASLGVETSDSLSLIETGERLHRGDEPSPARSAVLVRLSHGHIRIGSFQRLATLGQAAEMERLVGYVLTNLYGEDPGADAPERLFDHVVARSARLAASYMAAGFVHGVLNSDNINVTGESFDYGPWRFTPFWDAHFTAAYFDLHGLYAFGRQAQAIHWNLVQLARALTCLVPIGRLAPGLDAFPEVHEREYVAAMMKRLSIRSCGEIRDLALVSAIERGLAAHPVEIDRFFFDWAGGRRRGASPADAAYAEHFGEFERLVADHAPARRLDHGYWADSAPCSMHIGEVETIWAAIADRDDWAPFHAKVAAVRRMGEAYA